MTVSPKKLIFEQLKIGDSKVSKFDINDSKEIVKKSRKLQSKKLFKSQKLAKSEKKLSKSGNFLNFDTKKNRSSFLTSKAKMTFNHLRLVFTKAPIF